MDNALSVFEILILWNASIKVKKKGEVALKLDFSKAIDSLN